MADDALKRLKNGELPHLAEFVFNASIDIQEFRDSETFDALNPLVESLDRIQHAATAIIEATSPNTYAQEPRSA